MPHSSAGSLAPLSALADPVRQALFTHVAGSKRAVSRDEAAAAVGVTRALAAFHLEKLVRAGLLRAEQQRADPPRRGRPRKLYRPAGDLAINIPPRNYELVGSVFAKAVAARWRSMRSHVAKAARDHGALLAQGTRRRAGARPTRARVATALRAELETLGYAPKLKGDAIVLGNCPYLALSAEQRTTVCHLNCEFLTGFAEVLSPSFEVVAHPETPAAADGCCAALRIHP